MLNFKEIARIFKLIYYSNEVQYWFSSMKVWLIIQTEDNKCHWDQEEIFTECLYVSSIFDLEEIERKTINFLEALLSNKILIVSRINLFKKLKENIYILQRNFYLSF